jgi:hypothetical protein
MYSRSNNFAGRTKRELNRSKIKKISGNLREDESGENSREEMAGIRGEEMAGNLRKMAGNLIENGGENGGKTAGKTGEKRREI